MRSKNDSNTSAISRCAVQFKQFNNCYLQMALNWKRKRSYNSIDCSILSLVYIERDNIHFFTAPHPLSVDNTNYHERIVEIQVPERERQKIAVIISTRFREIFSKVCHDPSHTVQCNTNEKRKKNTGYQFESIYFPSTRCFLRV